MVSENKSKKPIAIILILLVLIITFGVIFWVWGKQGILTVLLIFIVAVFIIAFLGLIFFIVYWLFFKTHKKDAIHILKH